MKPPCSAAERFLEDGRQVRRTKFVEDGRTPPQRLDEFARQLIAEDIFGRGEGFGGESAARGAQQRETFAGTQADAARAGPRGLGANVTVLNDVQLPVVTRGRIEDDRADGKIRKPQMLGKELEIRARHAREGRIADEELHRHRADRFGRGHISLPRS